MNKWVLSIVFTIILILFVGRPVLAEDAKMFVPTSGWLVGPASVVPDARNGNAMPCIMASQYNNGFTFRFSGGNEQILATAIDFHQSAFKPGQSYTMTLSVSPSFSQKLKGTAYNDAILLVNTQAVDGLYKTLQQGKVMRIGIGGKEMNFMLAGTVDGLSRLESCYNPREAKATSPNRQQPARIPGMHTSSDRQPTQAMPDASETSNTTDPGNALSHQDEENEKKARFSLDTILKSAAKQVADIESAAGGAKIENSAPKPQGQALAQSWASPDLPAQAGQAKARDIMFNPADSSDLESHAGDRWWVAQGASLRETLDVWSQKAHAKLVWAAAEDFPVKEALKLSGSYETAVSSLLRQYQQDSARPVGKMYRDPSDNRPVLLIETE